MRKLVILATTLATLLCLSLPALAAPAEITWFGQSAFRIVTPTGKVLLVDPWIANPMNPNGKSDLEKLTKADLILVTHGHGDHVGNSVEIAKKTGAKLVAIFDLMKALVSYAGFPESQTGRQYTGNFGGQIPLLDGEVTVQFIPAVHGDSMDTPTGPVYAGHAGGFLISVKNGPRIYHTGDTDLFDDMALLKGQVDLMLVCIGDMFTMGPVRAAQAVDMIRPKMAVPMHYNPAFGLTGTPEQFKSALRKYGLEFLSHPMKVGETLTWDKQPTR